MSIYRQSIICANFGCMDLKANSSAVIHVVRKRSNALGLYHVNTAQREDYLAPSALTVLVEYTLSSINGISSLRLPADLGRKIAELESRLERCREHSSAGSYNANGESTKICA